MLPITQTKLDAYTQQIGKLNGVANPARKFAVAPAVAQTLRGKLKLSSEFLGNINIIPVVAQEGDKVGVGVKGTIASRTDTRVHDREPRYPGDLDERRYRCEKTDFDTLVRYETLDSWAHQPNFQVLLRDAIVNAKAIDIITIGFNGTHVAVETDPIAYPLLQDVNKGWLQHIREEAPTRVLADGSLTSPVTSWSSMPRAPISTSPKQTSSTSTRWSSMRSSCSTRTTARTPTWS